MKVTIRKEHLLKTVQKVQGALAERSLAHISLKTEGDSLHIAATDRVLAIYASSPANIKTTGEAFVAAKLFSDVVKELPPEEVSLSTDGPFLFVQSLGDARFLMKVPLVTGVKWTPPPEQKQENTGLQIPSKKLAYMLEQACFCIAQDSPRNYASVGYLHKSSNNKLCLVGTDGFRLSYCDIDFETPEDFLTKGLSLSKRALTEILKLCYESEDFIGFSVSQDATTILAEIEGCQIYILLSAVKYPNYRSVLPKKPTEIAQVSRSHLQAITRRVLLAADKTRALQLSFLKDQLKLSAKTTGSTEGSELLALAQHDNRECEVVLNGRFVMDIFSNAVCDNFSISFESEEQPIVFVPLAEPEGCSSKHVLVPIRESKG